MLIPKRILTVSSANMDFVMSVSKIPQGGETQLENGNYQFVPGGKGANQAVAAAKLGGEVVMLGCVGQDENGEAMVASMEAAGVNTAHLLRTAHADTSCAYICVSASGENCIVVEDAPAGIRAGSAAGMHTVLVPDQAAITQEIVDLSDAVLKSLLEMPAYMEKL